MVNYMVATLAVKTAVTLRSEFRFQPFLNVKPICC